MENQWISHRAKLFIALFTLITGCLFAFDWGEPVEIDSEEGSGATVEQPIDHGGDTSHPSGDCGCGY